MKDDPVRLWNVRLAEHVPMVVELDRSAENAKCFFVTRQPERFPRRADLDADYAAALATVAD